MEKRFRIAEIERTLNTTSLPNACPISEVSDTRLMPEKCLLEAELRSALMAACGIKTCVSDSANDLKRWQSAALQWLKSKEIYCNESRGISFGYICEVLNLPPSKIINAVTEQSPNLTSYLLKHSKISKQNQVANSFESRRSRISR